MYYHILLLIISYIKGAIEPLAYSTSQNRYFYLRNLDGKYKILFGRANVNEYHILDVNPLNNTLKLLKITLQKNITIYY